MMTSGMHRRPFEGRHLVCNPLHFINEIQLLETSIYFETLVV